jgi:hypothetical protein
MTGSRPPGAIHRTRLRASACQAIYSRIVSADVWYQALRTRWKPRHVRLLLIGESAPDDRGDPTNRRFFYSESLSGSKNLFRSVVSALYDSGKLSKGDAKAPWLQRLHDDGVYLIDLASSPVNSLTGSARRAALRNSVDSCVQRAAALAPEGIIVCHTPSFRILVEPLRAANLPTAAA